MQHLDLFSGIGGFALAARWAGFETVAFCECDPFCQGVLRKHWPTAQIQDDVRNVDGRDYRGVELISGGYPCQPFSSSGKRLGAKDDRHLWPEMRRIIEQARPTWVVSENVAGHITMGLDDVLSDLESLDYAARAVVIPACAVGANHRRARVWVVAHATEFGLGDNIPQQRHDPAPHIWGKWEEWEDKPVISGTDDGIPNRVDRIAAIGNAIVPQVAYELLRTMATYNVQSDRRSATTDAAKGEEG